MPIIRCIIRNKLTVLPTNFDFVERVEVIGEAESFWVFCVIQESVPHCFVKIFHKGGAVELLMCDSALKRAS